MPLRQTTVRFAPDALALVTRAADDLGMTVSQFVREAAMMRAVLTLYPRGTLEIRDLAEEVGRLARRDD